MPPAERRALLLLLALAVVGHAVLAWLHRPTPGVAPGDVRISGPSSSENLAAHRDSAAAADRPLADGEKIDLDKAPAALLARLPKVGPGMARKIAEYRASHGAFGSLERLNEVPGIGDGLIDAIRGHAEFSTAGTKSQLTSPAPPFDLPPQVRSLESRRSVVDLNRADQAELERLPGVGPSTARRIVEYRTKHGEFAAVDSLVRVGGIGPATVARLRGLVEVR
ncbi:MAG: helix-hairpin-helix domain-containing protein [Gemmatimonadota bacterium]